MTKDFLEEHRRALEDAYFARQNKELIRRMREADSSRSEKEKLAAASGLSDDALLDRLISLGFGSATVAALTLVPLVVVAWADGQPDEKEREAVLAVARGAGMAPGGPDQALLSHWLTEPPPPTLLSTWTDYVRAIGPEARAALRAEVLARARRVAEATGGFLGLFRKVSPGEEAMLKRLEKAFIA
jgi:hypothetical protein